MAEFSVAGRLRSFVYAARGLQLVLATQHNAWLHALATLVVVGAGAALGVAPLEWLALSLAIALVWTAEAFNTALELVCDAARPEFHPLIQKAKDVAAGAVLLSALGALAVGVLVFAPYVF